MVNFVVSEVLHDAAVFLLLLCGLTSIVTIVYYFRRRRFLRQVQAPFLFSFSLLITKTY